MQSRFGSQPPRIFWQPCTGPSSTLASTSSLFAACSIGTWSFGCEVQPAEPDDCCHTGLHPAGKLAGQSHISTPVGDPSRSGKQKVRTSKIDCEFPGGNWRLERKGDYAQRNR